MEDASSRLHLQFLGITIKKSLTNPESYDIRFDTVWEIIYLYIILYINIYMYKEIVY